MSKKIRIALAVLAAVGVIGGGFAAMQARVQPERKTACGTMSFPCWTGAPGPG